jgi:hypothetical protein
MTHSENQADIQVEVWRRSRDAQWTLGRRQLVTVIGLSGAVLLATVWHYGQGWSVSRRRGSTRWQTDVLFGGEKIDLRTEGNTYGQITKLERAKADSDDTCTHAYLPLLHAHEISVSDC